MGDCRLCGQKAGFLRKVHGECRSAQEVGWNEMVVMAARAAEAISFNQRDLELELMAVAQRSFYDGDGINAAIAEGWHRAVTASPTDGIVTRSEEARLREFREQFAVAVPEDAAAALELGARDRVMLDARLVAMSASGGGVALEELSYSVRELELSRAEERRLLVQAWEAAVEGSLEDGVLSLDEEAALVHYLSHFGLSVADVDRNGAHRNMVKSATIRELA